MLFTYIIFRILNFPKERNKEEVKKDINEKEREKEREKEGGRLKRGCGKVHTIPSCILSLFVSCPLDRCFAQFFSLLSLSSPVLLVHAALRAVGRCCVCVKKGALCRLRTIHHALYSVPHFGHLSVRNYYTP